MAPQPGSIGGEALRRYLQFVNEGEGQGYGLERLLTLTEITYLQRQSQRHSRSSSRAADYSRRKDGRYSGYLR